MLKSRNILFKTETVVRKLDKDFAEASFEDLPKTRKIRDKLIHAKINFLKVFFFDIVVGSKDGLILSINLLFTVNVHIK